MNIQARDFSYIKNWERLTDTLPVKTFADVKVSEGHAENITPKPANQDTFVREKSLAEDTGIYKRPVQQTNSDVGAEIKSAQQMKYKDGSSVLHLDAVSDETIPPKFETADYFQKKKIIDAINPEAEKAIQERLKAYRHCQIAVRTVDSWNAKIEELKGIVKSKGLGYAETEKLFKKECALWRENLRTTDPEAYEIWMESERKAQELMKKSKR